MFTVDPYLRRPVLIHTIPRGQQPVFGVTILFNEVFIVRSGSSEVEVYNSDTFNFVRCNEVNGLAQPWDLEACHINRCVYIADLDSPGWIHRVDLNGTMTRWKVNDEPYGLSVNANHNILVTCREARKLKELTSQGDLVREVLLPEEMVHPIHAVGCRRFIVCHGDKSDPINRVCSVNSAGKVMSSYGGPPGSGVGQLSCPQRVFVDDEGYVFVANRGNRTIYLLSWMLSDIRELVPGRSFNRTSGPWRFCLDTRKDRLLTTDLSNSEVLVFKVKCEQERNYLSHNCNNVDRVHFYKPNIRI